MTEVKHTPLPWKVSAGDIWPENGRMVKVADTVKPSPMNGIDWQANATFIVRACNSHYELLAALEKVRHLVPMTVMLPELNGGYGDNPVYAEVKSAIAKAKGAL